MVNFGIKLKLVRYLIAFFIYEFPITYASVAKFMNIFVEKENISYPICILFILAIEVT